MNEMENFSQLSTSDGKPQAASRPRGVTILALLVLILAVLHLTRFEQSINRWGFLQDLLPFSPAYLAINGAFWGLVGLLLVWAIWFRKTWTPQILRFAALVYSVNVWFERIILAGDPTRNTNWPFVAAVNLMALSFIFAQLVRKPVIRYFGEMHDH